MGTPALSLYEALLMNFSGELDLHSVPEHEQPVLSVLDNLQRILNGRAGSLAHVPDYGLPDMAGLLHGVPAASHDMACALRATLLKYEPRLTAVHVRELPQAKPGHWEYALDVTLAGGAHACFATTLGPEGRVVLRHLQAQRYLQRPGAGV